MYHLGHLELHAKRKMARHELEIMSAARVKSSKVSRPHVFYATLKSIFTRLPFAGPIFAGLSPKKQRI